MNREYQFISIHILNKHLQYIDMRRVLEYDACNFRPFQGQQSKDNLLAYFSFI